MPDENQSTTNPTATDDAATTADSTNVQDADIDMSGIDPNLKIPSLEDLEYATPSAYIDPDLPATPTDIDAPEEPEAEAPAEDTIEMTPEQIAEAIKASNKTMANVAEKIAASRNILIALSSDPSVDELAGALSLSLFLDRLGKHAIAVYSGTIPASLGFLNPDDNFEKNADVFQDFVASISKDKADHLRYKLEGDAVKIYITPYKSRIVAEDMEFSYGDYNVDLVLALNVANAIDLDESLREYGTIMHDATVVNITTGNPGKFGEVEWSNKFASSVSEMISNLLLSSNGDVKLNSEEATALLTGIVAATDRFAKANTFPGTMQIASRLLDAGADQQTVAANISDDLDNQFFAFSEAKQKAEKDAESEENYESLSFNFDSKAEPDEKLKDDDTALMISHGEAEEKPESDSENSTDAKDSADAPASTTSETPVATETPETPKAPEPPATLETPKAPEPESPATDPALLDELKATEASLSNVGAETVAAPEPVSEVTIPTSPISPSSETVISPVTSTSGPQDATSKYSQMLEAAIAAPATTPTTSMESSLPPIPNPAVASTPEVAATPEVTNMPDINYGQTMDDQLLPPPPTPPVDATATLPLPTPTDLSPTPAAPSVPSTPSTGTPDTFTIPGV
ncbi:hypothetical protein IJG95_01715 [Candidatus Saccharibacteria bacterium]|nr:hypothetical protein [Candidatus Saccharibacteria bacterium]